MRPFAYESAADARSAVRRYQPGAAYLAGGTDLVGLMRLGVAQPGLLIGISHAISDQIAVTDDGGLLIGAATRNSDLAAHPGVRRGYPALARAVLSGAPAQIRNMATVGGNLLQRTRCPYFHDVTTPCNKRDPGSGCRARAPAADTESMAIFGHSRACVATHPSDMAVALTALSARARVTGPAGTRTVPVPGMHRLPGAEPERDTVLEPGDLITAVELPPPRGRSAYRKVRQRASPPFALVSVAAVLDVAPDGMVRGCSLALGGAAHGPWKCRDAERCLVNHPATPDAFEAAADAEVSDARPLPGNAYKVALARNLIVSVLEDLAR